MKGTDRKVIFQGVHQLMGSDLGPPGRADEKRIQQNGVSLALICRKDILLQGMEQSLV
jgi:hypothetical protein